MLMINKSYGSSLQSGNAGNVPPGHPRNENNVLKYRSVPPEPAKFLFGDKN